MEREVMDIYCDGSGFSGINSAYCIIALHNGKKKKRIIKVIDDNLNSGEIEYIALIKALEFAKTIPEYKIKIFTDRISILDAIHNVKEENRGMYLKAVFLLKDENIDIYWTPRNRNIAGIELEKRLEKLHNYANCSAHIKSLTKKQRRNKYLRLHR